MKVKEAVRRMGSADTYQDRGWSRAVKVADHVVAKAEPGWLEELLDALLREDTPTYPMRYGFTAALRRLALTPGGADRIATVRRIAAASVTWGDGRRDASEVAEWLAAAQPRGHLLAALDTADPSDELAACLLQETALRHDATGASGFARRLLEAGHPLAGLPLRRTPAEAGIGLPWFPGLPKPDWAPAADGVPAPGPSGLDVTAAEVGWPDAHRALSAHRAWIYDSGENAEARLFELDRPIPPGDFGGTALGVLDAASTAGDLTGPTAATTGDVLRKLFGGATNGGAGGPGLPGSYARRSAWESLAALAGAPDGDIAAAEAAADASAWLFYTSDWHMQEHPSMDAGIAALRPDGRTVAVLAATDAH